MGCKTKVNFYPHARAKSSQKYKKLCLVVRIKKPSGGNIIYRLAIKYTHCSSQLRFRLRPWANSERGTSRAVKILFEREDLREIAKRNKRKNEFFVLFFFSFNIVKRYKKIRYLFASFNVPILGSISLQKPRYIEAKVWHYLLFMFSPLKIS